MKRLIIAAVSCLALASAAYALPRSFGLSKGWSMGPGFPGAPVTPPAGGGGGGGGVTNGQFDFTHAEGTTLFMAFH